MAPPRSHPSRSRTSSETHPIDSAKSNITYGEGLSALQKLIAANDRRALRQLQQAESERRESPITRESSREGRQGLQPRRPAHIKDIQQSGKKHHVGMSDEWEGEKSMETSNRNQAQPQSLGRHHRSDGRRNGPQTQRQRCLWDCCYVPIPIVIIIALIVWWLRITRTTSNQPIDSLINATVVTASAMEPLSKKHIWASNAHLYTCRIMEASAERYQYPNQHAVFTQAWEKGGLGWGCEKPGWFEDSNWDTHWHPSTPVDEDLGAMGLELAGAMWNVTLLLRRSFKDCGTAANSIHHVVWHVKEAAIRSNVCRDPDPRTLQHPHPTTWIEYFLHLIPQYRPPGPDAELADELARLNSTLSSFAALQSSMATKVVESVMIVARRLPDWKKAVETSPMPRGVALVAGIERLLKDIGQDFTNAGSSSHEGGERKALKPWETHAKEDAELSPFFKSKDLLDEASQILQSVDPSDREPRSIWINAPAFISTCQAAAASQRWQHRCRVLGAPFSSLSTALLSEYGDDQHVNTNTLKDIIDQMERWLAEDSVTEKGEE